MECIILFAIMSILSFMFVKSLLSPNKKSKSNNPITRIDDKNFIINNEFVSLEEDTPLKIFQQECEDKKHYNSYEIDRIIKDKVRICSEKMKTILAINNFPEIKDCVTPEKLNDITEKYNHYVDMCNKLDEKIFLTKEEFLIKEENPSLCVDFTISTHINANGFYTIYNKNTAKYIHGNMNGIIEKEFKEKWY